MRQQRVAGFRPISPLIRGKVRRLYQRLGESGLGSVLGIGGPVLQRVLNGYPVPQEIEVRVRLSVEEYEQRWMHLHESSESSDNSENTQHEEMEESPISRLNAVKQFRVLVWDKSGEVDPNDELDWLTLAYGFFLALGFDSSDAKNMASLVIEPDFY